jgi:carbon dioxide concentrating mechanism protein CcmN
MLLPPSQLIHERSFSSCGDVTIHPSAAIAPGVLLQANFGARLIIEAGVSIGMGGIVHVYEGTLTIATGACLGSGVLLVGSGKIGEKACIGSMTTLIDACVEAGQVIPPESLIGDSSRTVSIGDVSASNPSTLNGVNGATTPLAVAKPPASQISTLQPPASQTTTPKAVPLKATPALEFEASEALQPETSSSEALQPEVLQPETSSSETPTSEASPSEIPQTALGSEPSHEVQPPKVYGLTRFNGLMTSLFPHRQSLNQPLQPTGELEQPSQIAEG